MLFRNNNRAAGTPEVSYKPVIVFSFVILFWTMADSVGTYIAPLLIQEHGFSNTMIGIIIGTSSITGALFDFLICKIFKTTDFRRTLLVMFAICFCYPALLWHANTLTLFLFAMAVWGVYFDLYSFSTFDFIGRHATRAVHSSYFGLVQIFRSLGQLLATFIVGFVVVEAVNWRAFGLYWLFLSMGFIFLVALLLQQRALGSAAEPARPRRKHFLIELHLWKKMSHFMLPILLLTFFIFVIDSFYWTLAPLYAETIGFPAFGGLLLAAYIFPVLVIGLVVGMVTKRFGKKRTAFVSFFLGSAILSTFSYMPNPELALGVVLLASFFSSMALPSINAWYAGYIAHTPAVEGEIEGLQDFAGNIAYVLGPIAAGVLADAIGMGRSFSILGLVGALLAVTLLYITPLKIVVPIKPSEL